MKASDLLNKEANIVALVRDMRLQKLYAFKTLDREDRQSLVEMAKRLDVDAEWVVQRKSQPD